MYLGDTAVDDVIFSPGCIAKIYHVFPTITPCKHSEFACASNGNCRSTKMKCDGKMDCKDGTDENGCHGGGKSGKRTQTSKISITVGVVGGLVLLAIIVLVTFFIKRRRNNSNILQYISENLEVQYTR